MINFETRWIDSEKDYNIAADMLYSWQGVILPREYYPENGVIVSKNNIDLCSGWLYKTDSKVCFFEGVCLNKKAPRAFRPGAIDFIENILTQKAKSLGFKTVLSISIPDEHKEKLNKYGFIDQGKKNFFVKYI